jgi:acetyl-CoA carboxylase carboxyl transferase subunit alpha
MSNLRTPIISVVIGEGSSGGALGIGVGDRLAMVQYSTYFLISPDGCANIIWKTTDKAPEAAEAMGLTSTVLEGLGIVDHTIEEPAGGAHRDPDLAATRVKEYLLEQLRSLDAIAIDDLLDQRYERLMSYGKNS